MRVPLRTQCLTSWRAACRATTYERAMAMNHASFAGYLLRNDATVDGALAACPEGVWFDAVRETLRAVAKEEAGQVHTGGLRLVRGGP